MSEKPSYEVHVFSQGQWKVDSMYDNREIALFEAQRLVDGRYCSGVRVREERFLHHTGTYATRSIFRKTKVDAANSEVVERRKKVREEIRASRSNRPEKSADPASQRSGSGLHLFFLALRAAAIVVLGVGALLALRYFMYGS